MFISYIPGSNPPFLKVAASSPSRAATIWAALRLDLIVAEVCPLLRAMNCVIDDFADGSYCPIRYVVWSLFILIVNTEASDYCDVAGCCPIGKVIHYSLAPSCSQIPFNDRE